MKPIIVTILVLAAATPAPAFWPAVPRLPASAVEAGRRADTERNPVKLAERIGKNARAVGDLLAARDTGETTRETQAKILRDIDRLLEQAGDPPPPPQGGEGEPPPQGDPPPQGEGQPPPQGGDQPSGGQSQKPQGGQPQSKGGGKSSWRDKAGEQGGDPTPQAGQPRGGRPEPGDAKPTPGKPGTAGPGQAGKPESRPAPPAEDAVAKQVWGHLPEQLRREMNQYYKEQFMPKYGDMLRDYYSGLAESSRPVGK